MNTHAAINRRFAFHFPDLDTSVQVEHLEDGVVIRASRDTFSEERKACFIRELAAEGFIPGDDESLTICWVSEASPATRQRGLATRTDRFMIRLWLSSVLLLICMMGTLFVREYLTH